MKIVFWGTPQYAAENLINLINAKQDVIAVITQPDRKRGRGKDLLASPVKQAAINHAIPVYTTRQSFASSRPNSSSIATAISVFCFVNSVFITHETNYWHF